MPSLRYALRYETCRPFYLFNRQPGESQKQFTAFRAYLALGPKRSLAAVGRELGKSKALVERWSSHWSWVSRVEAYTDHMFRQADLEQQRELRGKIVTREEILEELSVIVRADPNEVLKLRYSDKVRAIELAGKHHHLFTEQIEVTQSVDVNVSHDVRATVHSLVQATQISEYDAALRLAEELADMPEVAAQFREWAVELAPPVGLAPKQIGPAAMDHNEHSQCDEYKGSLSSFPHHSLIPR